MTPTRHMVAVGRRRVHYTRLGDGPPVILLHASATSSGELRLAQEVFARDFTVIAVDTPGYGLSDPLTIEGTPEMADYADALAETLEVLGIGPAGVYGRHTGASIAVEFGQRHPARCTMVLTDGFPIWTEEERAKMLGTYLPALEPSWDGAHLLWSWFRYRDQHAFWPWFDWRAEKRATRDVPDLAFIQRGVIELLQAGDGYRVGYAGAFRHDGLVALAGMTVPVCLGTRPSDLIHVMRDRAPPGSWCVVAPPEPLAAAVFERGLLQSFPGKAPVPPAPASGAPPGRHRMDFVQVQGCSILMRRTAGTAAETLLLVPECPGAIAPATMDALDGPAIAFDLPGFGESGLPTGFVPGIEAWARLLLAALDAAGVGRVRIQAHRGGGTIAAALAQLAPDRVVGLCLDEPLIVSPAARAALVETYAPDMALSWDGTHLVRLWHHLRDQEIWWPWHTRTQAAALTTDPAIPAEDLTRRALACLRHPEVYRPAWQAIWAYPLAETLAQLRQPIEIRAGGAFGHLAERNAPV